MVDHKTAAAVVAKPREEALRFRFSIVRRTLCLTMAALGALDIVVAIAALAGVGDTAAADALLTGGVGIGQLALFAWLGLGHVTVTSAGIDSQALRHRFFARSEIADVQVRVVPTATYLTTFAPYVIRKDGSRARLAPMERLFDLDRVEGGAAAIRKVLGLPEE